MKLLGRLFATLTVAVAAAICAWPIAWLTFASFKTNREIYKPMQFLPKVWDPAGWHGLLHGTYFDFWTAYGNSFIIAGLQTIVGVAVASLAGYAFAWCPPRWRTFWFAVALSVVALPRQALGVPLVEWLIKLRLIDALAGVWLPGVVSGIGILYFSQVFRRLPRNLIESARIDGASEWRIYRSLLPLVAPSIAAFAIIQFILAWHEHLLPLLVLNSQDKLTLPLALASLYGNSQQTPQAVIMAGAVMGLLPMLVIFAIGWGRLRSAATELLADD